MSLPPSARTLIRLALREDLGAAGDLSTRLFLPPSSRLEGTIVAKAEGVVCGLDVAAAVFKAVSRGIRFRALVKDGSRVRPGRTLARVSGGREVLTAERTALNFLQRLSGIATLTRAYVDRVRGTGARVLDTRKTHPGWRELDKYAVRCGGGTNHRMGLYDMVMLKDNHVAAGGRLAEAVRRFRRTHPRIPIEIEAKTRAEVDLALACGADIILLDNMTPARLKTEIRRLRALAPETLLEVSGGVTLETIRAAAKLGPDRISVGALTHSAKALDMSLEIEAR